MLDNFWLTMVMGLGYFYQNILPLKCILKQGLVSGDQNQKLNVILTFEHTSVFIEASRRVKIHEVPQKVKGAMSLYLGTLGQRREDKCEYIRFPYSTSTCLTCLPEWTRLGVRKTLFSLKIFFFLMWTIFKVFTEFVTILLLFHVSVFWLLGMWEYQTT